jgi:hypothetical protein
MYVRGNGAKVLKKRFQSFDKLFIIGLMALIFGLYISMQSQIKSVIKETGDLKIEKKLLAEELDRMMADYDKTVSYTELRDFAGARLKMVESGSEIKSFTVIDKNEVFRTVYSNEMPQLFETRVNLALLTRGEKKSEN